MLTNPQLWLYVGLGLAAVLGAAWLRWALPRRALLGAIVGAGVGVAGAALLHTPLGFCAFTPDAPPAQAIFGGALMLLGAAAALWPTSTLLRQWLAGVPLSAAAPGTFRQAWLPWLLLLPTLLVLSFFLYTPFVTTLNLSTLLASRNRSRFVCLENYTDLPYDAEYRAAVGRTFGFAAVIVLGGLALALLIALLASQPVRGAGVYRTLLIWPYAISPAVAGVIFRLMFNPVGGVVNGLSLRWFGFSVDWLNNPTLASVVVIIASIWTQLGYNVLFYIAGLQSVPKDLLEAGAIDGANAVQRFFRITLPLLSPYTFFLVVTNTVFAFFDTFGTIDYLTGGGPVNGTTTMIYNVFETQRQNLGLGRAAAQSVVLFLMVVLLTVIQFRTGERRVTYGA